MSLQQGGYEQGPRILPLPVPEPHGLLLWLLTLFAVPRGGTRKKCRERTTLSFSVDRAKQVRLDPHFTTEAGTQPLDVTPKGGAGEECTMSAGSAGL